MILSKTCIYAIRAVLFTATYGETEKYVSIRRIAEGLGISFHFLTKILQVLTQKGIMNSYRGPKGGITLAKPAEEISVLDIVVAIDGKELFQDCLLGLPGCGEKKPCPLHEAWEKNRANLYDMFENTNIDRLAGKIASGDRRIVDEILGGSG